MRIRITMAAAAATATALLGVVPATAAHADAGRTAVSSSTPRAANGARVSQPLRYAIQHLPGAPSRPSGYERSKFKLWDDADHDCRDTRAEVLMSESKARTTGGCTIRTGRWYSYYDGVTTTVAHDFDIDHLVPLEEAWASGARSWSSAKREAYANDLADPRTLLAVSLHENRSKGDRDPAGWLPERAHCKYVAQWTAVKLRWGLRVNLAERAALERVAAGCSNVRITTHRARVIGAAAPVRHSGGGGTVPAPAPTHHGCTTTSSGSCIRGGAFCPQASYGQAGYDANGTRYVCSGDRTHPHWE